MRCPQCGETNPTEFIKGDKRCKRCLSKKAKRYSHSINGVVSITYSSQKLASKKRNHNPPSYSKTELREWLLSQRKFHRLYRRWVRNNYEKEYKPSCDRLDDTKGYSLDNIRLCTFDQNQRKEWELHRNGESVVNADYRITLQFTVDMELICEHKSMNIAARATKVQYANIWKVCNGERLTAGGFKWRYKDEN
jgi:hypothetical protein